MSSFLDKCKKCGAMIAKGSPFCPNCQYSEQQEGGAEASTRLVMEYRRRHAVHMRNYTIFMLCMLGTGFLGVATGYAAFSRRIAGTPIVGPFVLLVLVILALLSAAFLPVARKIFPHALHCPSCDIRLDETPLNRGSCPSCNARLQ